MPEASTRVLALQAGEIDFIEQYYFPLNAYQIFSRDPRFVAQEVNYPALNQIMLNTKRPPLDNPKVRQALLMALDRNFMLKNVFFGTGQVGRSAFDTRIKWSYNPAVDYDKLYPFNPAAAQKLLDEAGVARGPDGSRFTIRVTFESGRAEYIAWAQAIQRYWDAIGVKTVLDGAERNVTLKRVYADYDFGAHLQNYSTGGDPAIGIARAYVSDSIKQGQMFNNVSQYSNPEVDRLFEEGRKAADPAERARHYFQAQEILAKDLPVLTIHQAAQIAAADARLKDFALAGGYLWWNRVWRSK
jgi:peptide/nickel transport system substrate-binding protein